MHLIGKAWRHPKRQILGKVPFPFLDLPFQLVDRIQGERELGDLVVAAAVISATEMLPGIIMVNLKAVPTMMPMRVEAEIAKIKKAW